MIRDPQIESPTGIVPARKSKLRIKALMTWVALIGAGLGWVLHTERTGRALQADGAVFVSWIGEFQAAHPSFKLLGNSNKSSSTLFEMGRRYHYEFQSTPGQWITIDADLRSGPFHVNRRVNFDSNGRTVTWPFEDIEKGRKVDLKAEFPEAFR